jgi:energy-converting hydrogenase B subunit D
VNAVLQGVLLVLVAAAGIVVVLVRDPARQAVVAGLFGSLLGLLFFALRAPDVALSEIVVGTVAVPVVILLTLSKLSQTRGPDE